MKPLAEKKTVKYSNINYVIKSNDMYLSGMTDTGIEFSVNRDKALLYHDFNLAKAVKERIGGIIVVTVKTTVITTEEIL